MKTTNYGVLVIEKINGENHLFMCHSTNNTFWDIPKGGGENKEKPIESAIREFREETGNIATKNQLIDLGSFQYNYKKDLHLFLYKGEYIYPENSKCHSLFIFNNKAYPEVDEFKYVPFSLVKENCSKSFMKTFDLILEKIGEKIMEIEYYKKKIINMKLDDAIQYFNELKIKISSEKEEFIALKDIFITELSSYNKETKTQINLIADKLKVKYKDYRSAMLKDSTKKELPSTVISICNRELKSLTLLESYFPEIDENINKRLKEKCVRENANTLIEQIYSKKNEYIESFSTKQEGVRAWDCLIGCIESGHITSENIETYGITV